MVTWCNVEYSESIDAKYPLHMCVHGHDLDCYGFMSLLITNICMSISCHAMMFLQVHMHYVLLTWGWEKLYNGYFIRLQIDYEN